MDFSALRAEKELPRTISPRASSPRASRRSLRECRRAWMLTNLLTSFLHNVGRHEHFVAHDRGANLRCHHAGLQVSLVRRPSVWIRNKSPVNLKYSPVNLPATNFNWIALFALMRALTGFSKLGPPMITGFFP